MKVIACLVLLWTTASSETGGAQTPSLRALDLRCEYLVDPLGIDVLRPRLSWRLEASDVKARGLKQTGYQVLVATSPDSLSHDHGDLWDSGKVGSDQSLHVEYGGRPLASQMRCYWKVRAWDQDGRPSPWSPPAVWSMGLLKPEDWQAQWIGKDGGEESDLLAACGARWIWLEGGAASSAPAEPRCFRRTVTIPAGRKLRKATLQMTADDGFRLLVNGREVGKSEGHPNALTMDVSSDLRSGANVLAVAAYNKPGPPQNPAGLIGALRIEFAEGEPLVVVTDQRWRASAEAPTGWQTAALDDSAWAAARVLGPHGMAPWGPVGSSEHRRLAARMLRKEFQVDKQVRRATAYVCGLGFFELYLNGGKAGDHVMDPALSNYGKRAFYVTFDVTSQLHQGKNAVGVLLGNGRFFAPRINVPVYTPTFGYPKLLLKIRIELDDGSVTDVVSDGSWKVTTAGPIRANNEFDGEEYDARMEQPAWSEAGFDDSKWGPADRVQAPGGMLVAQMLEPMRVTEVLRPVSIIHPRPGSCLVDFGQNLYGMVRLKVRGPAGARVQLRTSFTKKPDGAIKMEDNRSALSSDVYVLKGQGEEIWAPRFRGQGTHYAEVTGWPGVPTADNFEFLAVHTDMEKVGEFTCSNELINKIYANLVRGTRMQERSVPLDPDRDERQAWLGHPAKTSESEAYLFNVAPFYGSFLGEVRIDQRADGNISDAGSVWPFYSGDPIWPSVITILPEWYYHFYGDRRVLQQNYDCMKRWVRFQEETNLGPDGTIQRGCYGDWVDAYTIGGRVGDGGGTSPRELWTAYFCHNCRIVARVAALLGKAEDVNRFSELADRTAAAFHKRFFKPENNQYESGTQCSYVVPLAFGLVPENRRKAVAANLVDDVLVKHQGHLSVGLVGMQWFMQVLTEIGRPDVAYTVATQTTRPSWGYMISKAATSVWERWDQDTRDPGMNGESQLILAGNLAAWMYQTLGGINYDRERPGFQHIILRPRPVGDLNFVRARHKCLYGLIHSQWRIEGGVFRWNVVVPVNTTATVHVPARGPDAVEEGGRPASEAKGVKFLRMAEGAAVYEVGSGEYCFVARR